MMVGDQYPSTVTRTPASEPATTWPVDDKFTAYQSLVFGILGFLLLCVVSRYWIIGPNVLFLMPQATLSSTEFTLMVSGYGLSAGSAGFLSTGLADYFDTKRLLLALISGFVAGFALCGLAEDFGTLLAGCIVSGTFGGMLGSVILAITFRVFVPRWRGHFAALIHLALATSPALGLPVALFLTSHWNWQRSFLLLGAAAVVAAVLMLFWFQPVSRPLSEQKTNPLPHQRQTIWDTGNIGRATVTALVTIHDFMIIPVCSVFATRNLSIDIDVLAVIYLIAGSVGLASGIFAARAALSAGFWPVFLMGNTLITVILLIYTSMEAASLAMVTVLNILLFIGVFVRLVPFVAMISSPPKPPAGNCFIAVNAAVQHWAAGTAAFVTGTFTLIGPESELLHVDMWGYALAAIAMLATALVWKIN